MSAFDERRVQDLAKLKDLAAQSGGKIKILKATGSPLDLLEIEMLYRTVGTKSYPETAQERTVLSLTLPSRYPIVEPIAKVLTPVFHPNIYTSGQICLGTKWLATQGLDLLVQRVARILTYDSSVVDENVAPANSDALVWYRTAKQRHPGKFPTDSVSFSSPASSPKISWRSIPDRPGKTEVHCTGCGKRLSVPLGKRGLAKCPACGTSFAVGS